MIRIVLVCSALLVSLSGCTFVKMAPGADLVRVVAQGRDMRACERRGEVSVSVKDRLGPYERDALRVTDELETLARNEAPSLSADTVQPAAAPNDGEQRFIAWRCAGALAADAPARPGEDSAETVPLAD